MLSHKYEVYFESNALPMCLLLPEYYGLTMVITHATFLQQSVGGSTSVYRFCSFDKDGKRIEIPPKVVALRSPDELPLDWISGDEKPNQESEYQEVWCIARGKPGEQFGGHVEGRYDICLFNGLWYCDGGTEIMDPGPYEWAYLPKR